MSGRRLQSKFARSGPETWGYLTPSLGLIIAFRLVNALLVQTFFQPDEYFQSLEPAWNTAFGKSSGAWITWVGI
jgi:phosphatidylinositol glycan class B